MEETNLVEIVKQIEKKEILLPDFQRGFVWNDEEMQKKLLASVLAKMPLGSILMLKGEADSYGCKQIGSKAREDVSQLGKKEVKLLLDGQQRVTVLTNIFSDIIFYNMDFNCRGLTSIGLRKRFYIKIPKYNKNDELPDIFGVNNLDFPMDNPQTDVPKFLTETILKYIDIESFKLADENKLASYPKAKYSKELTTMCMGKDNDVDYYKLPMFLMINATDDSKSIKRFNDILTTILEDIVDDMKEEYLKHDSSDEMELKTFVKSIIKDEDDYTEWENTDVDEQEKTFIKIMRKNGASQWQAKFKEYLVACINKMDLHQIVVEQSNRERAIDIYENLNLGGVTLSTFDLVLARAAGGCNEKDKNLFDKITEYIQDVKKYPNIVVPDKIEGYLKKFCEQGEYSASKRLECYKEDKNSIESKYTDSFLNVLSLVCNNSSYEADKVTIDTIKRKKILELSSKQINSNYECVCKGLDRACFFFNVRCGIRKLKELNYTLFLVLVAYIFTRDEYFNDKDIHKKLEALYWASVFSGEYDKDQNVTVIKHLKNFLESIKSGDYEWIDKIKENVFARKDFSDKAALIPASGDVSPKSVLRTAICQFFLAETYPDMLDSDKHINVFMSEKVELDEHHIMPRGELSVKMSKIDNDRKNKTSIINSPLNFAYITPETNKTISNTTLEQYIKKCKDETMVSLGINTFSNDITESDVKTFLNKRFEFVNGKVREHIKGLLA